MPDVIIIIIFIIIIITVVILVSRIRRYCCPIRPGGEQRGGSSRKGLSPRWSQGEDFVDAGSSMPSWVQGQTSWTQPYGSIPPRVLTPQASLPFLTGTHSTDMFGLRCSLSHLSGWFLQYNSA